MASAGKNGGRDWYRLVNERRQAVVSEVYRRHAQPSIHVVSIATPINAVATGETIAFLVYQLSLDELSSRLKQVSGSESELFVVDHTGTLAAHPRVREATASGREVYASSPAVKRALEGRDTTFELNDPLAGIRMTGAAVPIEVGRRRWAVVAQRRAAAVTSPLERVADRLFIAGALPCLASLGAVAALARLGARGRRLSRQLESASATVVDRERALSVASHEIRSPLGPLTLQLYLLRERLERESPETARKFAPSLDLLDRQVKRISRLGDELLAAPRSRRRSMEIERIDLSDLVRDVCQQIASAAEGAGVALRVEAPSAVSGCWQRTHLEQARREPTGTLRLDQGTLLPARSRSSRGATWLSFGSLPRFLPTRSQSWAELLS